MLSSLFKVLTKDPVYCCLFISDPSLGLDACFEILKPRVLAILEPSSARPEAKDILFLLLVYLLSMELLFLSL
mgnify:CR=1 FL=1